MRSGNKLNNLGKPGAKPEAEEQEPTPDVERGDEVYFRHPKHGPVHGKVIAHGRHGCVLDCAADKKRYRVQWAQVLGHRVKVQAGYTIVDQGEDGFIAADQGGRRRYIEDPDPDVFSGEEPVRKSFAPMALMFFAGAPPADIFKAIKNRPGLSLQDVTDKQGHQTKRWKRTTPKINTPERQAKPKPEQNAPAKMGDSVQFQIGETKGSGEVVSSGGAGAQVRDAGGQVHKVRWNELKRGAAKKAQASTKPDSDAPSQHAATSAAAPKSPAYPPRLHGEDDKAYGKRAKGVLPVPESMPEEHERFFKVDGGTSVIPIDKLRSSKTDEENKSGGENAPKLMMASYHGKIARRAPIKVTPNEDGTYKIIDGNGTYTAAKRYGWKELPTVVVQPFATKEKLYAASKPALEHLTSWLGGPKGVCTQLGVRRMNKAPEDVSDEEWGEAGSMLFIAPLKKEDRATQKVNADYGGDWSRLMDTVRCTIAVDSLEEVYHTIDKLKQNGLVLAKPFKDRFKKPTKAGYSDVQMFARMANGVIAEIQVNVKPMVQTKHEAHKFYEIERDLEVKYGKETPTAEWPAEARAEYERVLATQQRMYREARSKYEKTHL